VCFLKNKGNIPLTPHSEAVTGRKIGSQQFSISKNQDAPGYDYERFDPLPAIANGFALQSRNAKPSATMYQSKFAS
jgi:hypothetical protein